MIKHPMDAPLYDLADVTLQIRQLTSGVAFVLTLGVTPPAFAGSQEAEVPVTEQTLNPVVRSVALPPAQSVSPGSASTSPSERRSMEAVRMDTDESITLDGRLDEDVWMRAVPATNFLQRDPDTASPPPSRRKCASSTYSDKLYMGVTLFDSEPDRLIYYHAAAGPGSAAGAVPRGTGPPVRD